MSLNNKYSNISNKLLTWFFRGLLIVLPISVTIYLLISIFSWLDGLLGFKHTGLGVLLLFAIIIVIGMFGTSLITKPFINLIETLIEKTPGIKLIYTSIKDLLAAFVGDKKKFNKPVMINVEGESVYKIGFITSESLKDLNMEGYCSVYIPFSYTFSGHLYIVHTSKIKPIDGNPADLMKFVASGGVTQL
ncbi:MAG: DUF502 domain-containing protein [Bacteroidia bacterium]|jgi:uncharacterized membrane protein|nr:DUF502 domain-containing protein [Bacteroidota bacterium]MCZ2130311.1 DUF502 domain-containing protein [Bacteroidia bacterium]